MFGAARFVIVRMDARAAHRERGREGKKEGADLLLERILAVVSLAATDAFFEWIDTLISTMNVFLLTVALVWLWKALVNAYWED